MSRRALTIKERTMLNMLLSSKFPGSAELRKQLEDIEVEGTNDPDNYGSICLFTRSKEKARVTSRVPVEGLVNDSDGETVNIILHVEGGFLNELEVVKLDGTPMKSEVNPNAIEVIVNKD